MKTCTVHYSLLVLIIGISLALSQSVGNPNPVSPNPRPGSNCPTLEQLCLENPGKNYIVTDVTGNAPLQEKFRPGTYYEFDAAGDPYNIGFRVLILYSGMEPPQDIANLGVIVFNPTNVSGCIQSINVDDMRNINKLASNLTLFRVATRGGGVPVETARAGLANSVDMLVVTSNGSSLEFLYNGAVNGSITVNESQSFPTAEFINRVFNKTSFNYNPAPVQGAPQSQQYYSVVYNGPNLGAVSNFTYVDGICPQLSLSPTSTPSDTSDPSETSTASLTSTVSLSGSISPSNAPSVSLTSSTSFSASTSLTPSITPSASVSVSNTASVSLTSTATATPSNSISLSATPSISTSPSVSPSISITPTISITPSITPSTGASLSTSTSFSFSRSLSASRSFSLSRPASNSPSVSQSISASRSFSKSTSFTSTISPSLNTTPSKSLSKSNPVSLTSTRSKTASRSKFPRLPSFSPRIPGQIPCLPKYISALISFALPPAFRLKTSESFSFGASTYFLPSLYWPNGKPVHVTLSYDNNSGQSRLSYSKGVLVNAGSISASSNAIKGASLGTKVLVYCQSFALLQAKIDNVIVNGEQDQEIDVTVPFNAPFLASVAAGGWSGDLGDNGGVVTVEMDLTFSWFGLIPVGSAQCGMQIELL